jgi:hypothetical protein
MEQGQTGRGNRWKSVVIGEDHLHPKGDRPLQRCLGTDAVVNRDQEVDACCRQTLDHGGIEAIAFLLTTGDGGLGSSSQTLQKTRQQGGAGHAVRVVIPTDRHGFTTSGGLGQSAHGTLEVREMAVGIGGLLDPQQSLQRSCIRLATTGQHGQKLRWQLMASISQNLEGQS